MAYNADGPPQHIANNPGYKIMEHNGYEWATGLGPHQQGHLFQAPHIGMPVYYKCTVGLINLRLLRWDPIWKRMVHRKARETVVMPRLRYPDLDEWTDYNYVKDANDVVITTHEQIRVDFQNAFVRQTPQIQMPPHM